MTTTAVEITLLDVNDNAPIFVENSIEVDVNETDSAVQVQV